MHPVDEHAYAALDLAPDATWEQIQDAWRRLAKLHHPDRHAGSPAATRRLQAINAAYEHLRERVRPGYERRYLLPFERQRVWDLVWRPERWPEWIDEVDLATRDGSRTDRRYRVSGHWGSQRWVAYVQIGGLQPCHGLWARVVEFKVAGEPIEFETPPRVRLLLSDHPVGTQLDLRVLASVYRDREGRFRRLAA